MKKPFLSIYREGKRAEFLMLIAVFSMLLKYAGLAAAIRFPLPSPLIALIGVVAFFFALYSYVKNRDSASSVIIILFLGGLIIFWIIAEILFPH